MSSPSVSTKRRRTRRQRIDSLIKRYAWLKNKREAMKEAGKPTSYLTEEIDALEWALPILQAQVDDDR